MLLPQVSLRGLLILGWQYVGYKPAHNGVLWILISLGEFPTSIWLVG